MDADIPLVDGDAHKLAQPAVVRRAAHVDHGGQGTQEWVKRARIAAQEPAYQLGLVALAYPVGERQLLAIVSGIASLFFGAFVGLLLAVAAIILGIIGMLLAASPSIRGGIISIMSILAGLIGIIAAVFKLFF